MRDLTSKQKKLLDKWYEEQKNADRVLGLFWDVGKDMNFSTDLWNEIYELNPCEITYDNINNYISERVSEDLERSIR